MMRKDKELKGIIIKKNHSINHSTNILKWANDFENTSE